MNKELLEKYLNNTCNEEELRSVLEWFDQPVVACEGRSMLFGLWEGLPDNESPLQTDFDHILDEIHHKINLVRSENLSEEADKNLTRLNRKKYFINIFTRVAAILFIPVLIFGLYMTSKYRSSINSQGSETLAYNEVISSVDAITRVTLPDGSKVWLNHSSTLKYPAIFQGGSRTIELSGEGYFEVAHNPKLPFIVKAGEIQIQARGTIFNVLAYPGEDRIETSLIEGNVDLQMIDEKRNVVPLLKMKPDCLAIYQISDKKITTLNIEDDRNYSWIEGKLIFKKEPMDEVVKKLSRWFNVDIQINDPRLRELTYTATFVQETLPQVMELIAMVSPVSYSISKREEMSNGIFTKRKVILNYNKSRALNPTKSIK